MKYVKRLETGRDFNLLNGWINKETIIRRICFFYLIPFISDTKKTITWLRWQLILPH